ncbi:universal stress protein [Hymenobacter properus]|uniref:Universal stress protein n=1 Tax=Hymenobacter properus TaxID=2791026 RepID=A0A931BMA4_9BACT|nr:universal stress protein [Hymenobacter properus]MBF9142878.1 universal stress protein [Hymenobacter properus]MBR7721685.1 universal stress protein [Microvirga sp. SRT04]
MDASLLILTDFFQAANQALDYATNLAGALKARLVLLHVRRNSLLDPDMLSGSLSNLTPEAVHLALGSVAGHLPVPVVAEIGHGRVAEAVVDAVRRHHPLLVVLGRPDYSDLPDELVQTTSLDLLRAEVPCPMLVVPHGIASTAPPKRLLLAVDGCPLKLGDPSSATYQLLEALGAAITVFHVIPDTGPQELAPLVMNSLVRTGLVAHLPAVESHTVVSSHAATGILEAAQSGDYDMVAVVARRHCFTGSLFHHSVTAEVMRESQLPVLVLPAQ